MSPVFIRFTPTQTAQPEISIKLDHDQMDAFHQIYLFCKWYMHRECASV